MIYQELLYSRSLSKDYRWMIVPPKVSPESLKALNQLYNLYDKYKSTFSKSPVLPLYCLNQPEATFLVSCGLSNHRDKEGRDIYCLQGISIAQEYQRHFWFILPWIVANHGSEGLLNTWKNIDFPDADDIVHRISKDHSFKLDQLDESLAELTKTPKSTEKLSIDEPLYISFDKNGLKELSRVVSLHHDCMDFAFGVTPEMAKNFDFRIIAKAERRFKIKSGRELVTADRVPSFGSDDGRDKTIDKHFDDPVDRFDPRKKVNVRQTKTLRGNGPSHIFSQVLPRFLSVLKLGKKLRRFSSSCQRKEKE
ncbi:MAG: hypothetical protein E3K36_08575 [Candidatus Brocadia sp.]|nr:hypothetical protein [Candidatus Brocadia sp.]